MCTIMFTVGGIIAVVTLYLRVNVVNIVLHINDINKSQNPSINAIH